MLLRLLKKVVRRLTGRPEPGAAVAVHPFDRLHGVETSGLLEGKHLQTGHVNDAGNTAYFGVPPSRFLHAVEQWRATAGTRPIEQYRFIDVGCGKGRAVLLASRLPFRDVVGVELHPQLAALARTNLAHWAQSGPTSAASIVCADAPAALPDLLHGPVLLYIYNPFRSPVLRELLKVIVEISQERDVVDILYLYPEFDQVFAEFPQFERLWRQDIPLAAEDEGDGLSAAFDPCSLYRLLPPGTEAEATQTC